MREYQLNTVFTQNIGTPKLLAIKLQYKEDVKATLRMVCLILYAVFRKYLVHALWKSIFGHMRTAKAQISLCIHTVWSGPSLSANRVRYCRMYEWRAKAWIEPCVGWISIFYACSKALFWHLMVDVLQLVLHCSYKYTSSFGKRKKKKKKKEKWNFRFLE